MASKIDTDKLKAITVNLSKPSSNVEKSVYYQFVTKFLIISFLLKNLIN